MHYYAYKPNKTHMEELRAGYIIAANRFMGVFYTDRIAKEHIRMYQKSNEKSLALAINVNSQLRGFAFGGWQDGFISREMFDKLDKTLDFEIVLKYIFVKAGNDKIIVLKELLTRLIIDLNESVITIEELFDLVYSIMDEHYREDERGNIFIPHVKTGIKLKKDLTKTDKKELMLFKNWTVPRI